MEKHREEPGTIQTAEDCVNTALSEQELVSVAAPVRAIQNSKI